MKSFDKERIYICIDSLQVLFQTLGIFALKLRLSKIIRIFEFFDGAVQKTIEEQVESTELKTVHIAVQNKFKNSYCEIMGAAEDFITQRPRFDSS